MTDKDQIQPIITAYLSGKATAEECRELEEWLMQAPENNRYFQQMRNVWQTMYPAFDPDEISVSEAEKKLLTHLTKPKSKRVYWVYWQRVAGILLIPMFLLCTYLYFKTESDVYNTTEYQEVKSPHGAFSEVHLPDGSRVWLNGGSSLKYPLTFRKGERTVFLHGEGYFEVHADAGNPFVVQTNQITLRATGTAFNIEAYESDSIAAVTMVSGKVDIAFGNSALLAMTPGERASFNTLTRQCVITQTDPYKWYAWKDGLMIFRDDPLWYVFKRVGQAFNVHIELKDSSLANAPYRATFGNEPLDEILRLLEMSAPIRFKQAERAIDPHGVYKRQKIEVFRENNTK